MNLETAAYSAQSRQWPDQGRHILAQFDSDTIVVYQAYKPSIGRFAAAHGFFGGDWRPSRMTWIKPNFLWMMYRSGWATKQGQETILAVRLRRAAFDEILASAVLSTFESSAFDSIDNWKAAVRASSVRCQWDPDHGPTGAKLERRAIQLGLRGVMAKRYAHDMLVSIEDITDFVAAQKSNATPGRYDALLTPVERVYDVRDQSIARRLGMV